MTKFKVGDRVRLTGAEWEHSEEWLTTGAVVTIERVDGDGELYFVGNPHPWDVRYDGWEVEKEHPVRPHYGTAYEFAENVRESSTTQVTAEDTLKVRTLGEQLGAATPVNPDHYKFPGGAEVIDISQWLTSNSAQALQYVARSSRIDGKNKGDASEDIRKAITFLEFELKRLEESE